MSYFKHTEKYKWSNEKSQMIKSENTGCYWITPGLICFSFLYTFSHNLISPTLICTVVIRGFRSCCHALRAPLSLTTTTQPYRGHAHADPQAISSCSGATTTGPVSSCAHPIPMEVPVPMPRIRAALLPAVSGIGLDASPCFAGVFMALGSYSLSLREQPSLTAPGNHIEKKNCKHHNFYFLEFFVKAKWIRPKYYLYQPQDIQRRRNNARIFLPSFSKTAILCAMATITWKSKLTIDNIH